MNAFVVLIVGLGVPGLLPAIALARRSPAVIFLAPVLGATMAAVAAELELAFPGSLLTHYEQVAVTVNVLVLGWLVASRLPWTAARVPAGPSAPWSKMPWVWAVLTAAVIVAALRLPLAGLRAEIVGWDANSIWLTHALLVSGGHHQLLAGLQNKTYHFTNPDYPPLVPAAGALAFAFFGNGKIYLAVHMTELVAACGLGLLAAGLVAAAENGRWLARLPAIAAAAAICVAGFGVAGVPGLAGYADLPWAAAAAAAIVWGLVVPKSTQALIISWICAVAASLTKNEGFTTALAIIILIALRYVPLAWPRVRAYRKGKFLCLHCVRRAAVRVALSWAQRAGLIVLPVLPGLIWIAQVRHLGLHDAFFGTYHSESLSTRASATIRGMGPYLDVAPVALGLLLLGSLLLRKDRRRLGLANPAWLWLACVAGLGSIFVTYIIGVVNIHTWLHSSVNRTTVFAQLTMYTDVAIWLVIAFQAAFRREPGALTWSYRRRFRARSDPEHRDAERAGEAVLAEPQLYAGTADAEFPTGELVPLPADLGSPHHGNGFTAIGPGLDFPDGDDGHDLAPELAGYAPPDP